MKSLVLSVALLSLLSGCSNAPRCSIASAGFPVSSVETHKFKKGDPTHGIEAVRYGGIAYDDFTRLFGKWMDPTFEKYDLTGRYYGAEAYRHWNIEVHSSAPERVRRAIETAKDGYEAALGWIPDASARIYPRFERKQFSWGVAVSFFVQYQNIQMVFAWKK